MAFLNKVNVIRRRITNALTRNVGGSDFDIQIDPNTKVDIKRVFISRPNHRLGNMLLLTPLLQEVIAAFPNCKIDLFAKGGLAPILLEHYDNVDRVIKLPKKPFSNLFNYFKGWFAIRKYHYDLVINGDKNSSSGRLSTKFTKGTFKIYGDVNAEDAEKYPDHVHIAKYPVYTFRRFLSQIGIDRTHEPMPLLDLRLTSSELAKGKKVLDDIIKNDNKTLALYTYATADKCYSESWWTTFYERLLTEFPDYNIIEVLPIENVSQIGFKAPSFYGKDIREIAALFANTNMYIGADCGIMHLASAALIPTVGLFSRANIRIYEPYGNNSISISTTTQDLEHYIIAIKNILDNK
jgi:ADP-heptose:LPS heptosyltransferase